MARPTQEQVEAEIAPLPALSLEELRERWRVLYGNPAPRSPRRDLLMRAVAYQIQVKAFGRYAEVCRRGGSLGGRTPRRMAPWTGM